MESMLPGQFVVDRRRVVDETIDGETILVQLDSGNYYSLRGVGVEIWALLASGHSTDELIEVLRRRYGPAAGPLEQAVRALVAELVDEQLLTPFDGAPGERPPRHDVALAEPCPAPTLPKLEKFTDMQGFLLLDPIHDTDSTGWPHRKSVA